MENKMQEDYSGAEAAAKIKGLLSYAHIAYCKRTSGNVL